ncbi:hypothetical protein [Aliiruegeria lutimaris]|nr:hypothetical protein [Aliiruegeria lutimaris]
MCEMRDRCVARKFEGASFIGSSLLDRRAPPPCAIDPLVHKRQDIYLIPKGKSMSKGNKKRSNREVKKPKKIKEKAPATADFSKGRSPATLGEKKKP